LATLVNAMVVDGQRHVTAAVRAFELSQPRSIRRLPGNAIVGPPGADPSDTWDRHRVDPSFCEQLLRRESQKEFRIWLSVERAGGTVIATVGRRSGRSRQVTVFGKPRCQVVVDW